MITVEVDQVLDEDLANYRKMSKEDLRKELVELEGDLKELEEQNLFMLRSTGHHIRGVVRKKYAKKIAGIEEKIRVLKRVLQES